MFLLYKPFFMTTEKSLIKAEYEKQKFRQKLPPYPNKTMEELQEMLKKLNPKSKKARQIMKQLIVYNADE